MKFNSFLWNLYSQSKQGKKAIKRFSHLTNDFIEPDLHFFPFEFFDKFKGKYPVDAFEIDLPQLLRDAISTRIFKNLKAASQYYKNTLIRKGIPFEMADKRGHKSVVLAFLEESDWYDYIGAISLGLYWGSREFFLPYNFRCKFNQLEELHNEFGIPLPPTPGKADKMGRCHFYIEVNAAWQEFRHRYGLSAAEMCAFLYDFAPQFTTPLNAADLPLPSKVWLITGGSWDIEFADSATAESVQHWGGNPAIRRGDILVMYLVRPRSCLHSIWRACSDGFIDPLFHYHGTVWICNPIKIKPVTYADLSQHPLLSQKGAVKAHFQGPSSKAPFSIEEYEALLGIMKSKGQKISQLPRILSANCLPSVDVLNERDVEVRLIEPLLLRLGYRSTDWVRQMPVKMGRGERNYPDYAFGARTKRGEESASMILESKFQLSSHSEFMDAFYQAKSYALRLQSKMMVMAAKEGVWVFPPQNGSFEIKKFVNKGWGELNHPDGLHEVLSLIHKDKILN